MRRKPLVIGGLFLILVLTAIAGCSDLGYFLQCARGQFEITSKRRPIDTVLNDPRVSASTKQQLQRAREIRRFATQTLALPDNNSYYEYADLGRDYVLWNVVATPEFSLDPIRWCFPVAGCVPYRGYYQQDAAEAYAVDLRLRGNDVWVYGVPAYSTLNWFSDPVLNTFSHYQETALAGLIFHELAHQQVYLAGQADFNEAFAEAVEHEGVLRWLESHGDGIKTERYRQQLRHEEWFLQLAAATRSELQQLYNSGMDVAVMRQRKLRLLDQFQASLNDYLRQEHLTGFSAWLSADLNNARFASLNTYRRLVPAFGNLLALQHGSLPDFYREVARIAKLPQDERTAVLRHLSAVTTERVLPGPVLSQLQH